MCECDAFAFPEKDIRQRPTSTLAQGYDAAPSSAPVLTQSPIDTIGAAVRGAHLAADERTIDLDCATQHQPSGLGGKRLTQLMEQDKSGFVGDIDRARELKRGQALSGIGDECDATEQVLKAKFVGREDRSGRHAELMMAGVTLKLASRPNPIGLIKTATRANRPPVRLRPPQMAETPISGLFPVIVDRLQ